MGGPATFKGTGNSLEAVTSFQARPPAAPLTSSLVIHLFASCPISLRSILHIAARQNFLKHRYLSLFWLL